MTNMTGGAAGTMANWTKEVWSQKATVTFRSNVILADLVDRSWEPELGVGGGDTIHIAKFSQNTGAVARSTFGTAAGLSSELIATTEGQVNLVVNKMAIYGYAQPKEAKLQAMPSYATHLDEGIATALSLYLDAQISADTTNGFAGFSTTVGTDNVDLTEDNIITCMTDLDNASAKSEDRFLVVCPASFASLLGYEAFRNQLYGKSIGNLSANKGPGLKGGPVYGFMVYQSNNLAAGTAGHKNAAFQRDADALCVQQNVEIDREFSVIDGLISYVAGSIVFGQIEVKDGDGIYLAGK